MNAPGRIGKLLGIATLLSVVGAGSALAMGNTVWAGGLILGAFLGLTPFASWTWIVTRGLGSRRNKIMAGVIVLSKLGIYGLAITLFARAGLINTLGLATGMTGAIAIMLLGLMGGGEPKPGEAA